MSKEEEETVKKSPFEMFKNRKTYYYTFEEVCNQAECPSCGRPLDKLKNIKAHVKRCFSIKKIGPIYRLHGYVECKCGILIADNQIAKKLHLCMGEVPPFEPDWSYLQSESSVICMPTEKKPVDSGILSMPRQDRERPQNKPWIRNFVSPIKLDRENMHENIKPEPHVRNFDIPTNRLDPENVSVYYISSNNGTICVTGQSPKSKSNLVKYPLKSPRFAGSTGR